MSKTPTLTVFGGPNGSGKTTVTRHYPVSGVYINADIIKVQQNCTDREAAEIATALREKYLKMDEDFTDMPPELMAKYAEQFRYPEKFVRLAGEIIAVKQPATDKTQEEVPKPSRSGPEL